jgi:hypothetical protein
MAAISGLLKIPIRLNKFGYFSHTATSPSRFRLTGNMGILRQHSVLRGAVDNGWLDQRRPSYKIRHQTLSGIPPMFSEENGLDIISAGGAAVFEQSVRRHDAMASLRARRSGSFQCPARLRV